MLELIKGANLALRFLLELCALGALAYWGFKTGSGALTRVGLGIGAPLVAAVVWGTFVSPQAPVQLPGPLVLGLQALVFGSAAAGLVATGHRTLALVFGAIIVINAVLMYVWGQ
jgi:quinol-cytochrome oxidoreductase complex cytochrome b subunit